VSGLRSISLLNLSHEALKAKIWKISPFKDRHDFRTRVFVRGREEGFDCFELSGLLFALGVIGPY
jgi:hypothetical protein